MRTAGLLGVSLCLSAYLMSGFFTSSYPPVSQGLFHEITPALTMAVLLDFPPFDTDPNGLVCALLSTTPPCHNRLASGIHENC